LINHLQIFQKQLKYGLSTETTIALYEFGFSYRVISQNLIASLRLTAARKNSLVNALKQHGDGAESVMENTQDIFKSE